MRGDGLSKAVENESLTSSEENINNLSRQNSKVNQPTRFRIGSSSSIMSKVKNFFVEAKDKEENNNAPKMDEKYSSGMFGILLLLAWSEIDVYLYRFNVQDMIKFLAFLLLSIG